MTSTLTCDGWCGHEPISDAGYIDTQGWAYCVPCGQRRQMSQPARTLTPSELARLQNGQSIPRY